MKLKLDVKSLVTGVAVGIILAIVAGAGSADADRFGIAVEEKGMAVVRANNGYFYVINPDTGMAVKVLYAGIKADPEDKRDSSGKSFP